MTSGGGEATGDAFGEEAIFVALGTDLKKGKVLLEWVFEHLPSKEVVVLHVHKPPKLIPMHMGGKFPIHMAAPEEAAIYIEANRAKMNALVHAYIRFCARHRVPAKTLVIETDDVVKGIVYLVGQYQIKKLVMGLKSFKNQRILEGGLLACQVWLVYGGKLIFSREALMQEISPEIRGDENRGDSISSLQSAKEISSPRSAKERSSTSSARELSSIGSSKESSSASSLRETSTTKSVKEISSSGSVKEVPSPKSAKGTSESHESHQDYMALEPCESWSMKSAEEPLVSTLKALGPSESWSVKSAEEPLDPTLKVEETEVGLRNETFEAEDIRDLVAQLAEVVHVAFKQRLDLSRQMLVLKQEFIEFSLPELEEAAQRLTVKRHT